MKCYYLHEFGSVFGAKTYGFEQVPVVQFSHNVIDLGFRVQGLGFRAIGIGGLGFGVRGLGLLGFRVSETSFTVWSSNVSGATAPRHGKQLSLDTHS